MPPRLPLPPIDAASIKDVARSLRFAVEQGGRSLRKGLPLDALPEPAARLADAAFSTVERLGDHAGRGASTLAHALFDTEGPPPPLSHPEEAAAEARFAAAVHEGLKTALRHMGAESYLVSETAAAMAWRHAARLGPAESDSATAARLFQALMAAPALRDVVWPEGMTPPADAPRLAAFAVLLAMLSDPTGFHDIVPAATDIAIAVGADLARCEDSDTLQGLFEEFRNHV